MQSGRFRLALVYYEKLVLLIRGGMGVKRGSPDMPPEGWWTRLVNMAIRPPRARYQLSDLPGPKFSVGGRVIVRRTVTVSLIDL